MVTKTVFRGVAAALCVMLAAIGCKKSNSTDNTGGAAQAAETAQGATQFTGAQREAYDAAFAEIARHCVKGPDGWTTALIQGSPYAPDHFVRQYRQIIVDGIEPAELTDADRLNGVEWSGQVTFKQIPAREAGDPGAAWGGMAGVNRVKGSWTTWFDCTPEWMRLAKVKGKWQVNQDNTLLRGQLPVPGDLANAGVK